MLQSLFPRQEPSSDPCILLGKRGHSYDCKAASAGDTPLSRHCGYIRSDRFHKPTLKWRRHCYFHFPDGATEDQMVRVTVRRITVGQGLRCSKHFSSEVGLGGEAMEVYFLLLMANNTSLSGEKLQSSINPHPASSESVILSWEASGSPFRKYDYNGHWEDFRSSDSAGRSVSANTLEILTVVSSSSSRSSSLCLIV